MTIGSLNRGLPTGDSAPVGFPPPGSAAHACAPPLSPPRQTTASPPAAREPVAPGPRVTQADIARAAGVHNTTVSLALRRSPLIPEATRERIQAIARSLGYTPDPALRALAAYRNRHSAARRGETLVYLTAGESGGDSRESAAQTAHAASARRKAEELGFQFKPVCLSETGLNLRRLDRMLEHAGIRCAILASPPWSGTDWSALNWARLCAVAIGDASPLTPRLHHVTIDDGAIMRLALQRVRRAGYRHIGLALTRPQNQFGLPAIPTVTCVGGTWCDGASLPVRRLPADDEAERSAPVSLPRNLVA